MLTAPVTQNQPEHCEWEHPSFTWLKMLCWSPLGSSGFWGVGGGKGDTGPCCILPAQPCWNLFLLQALMLLVCLASLCVGHPLEAAICTMRLIPGGNSVSSLSKSPPYTERKSGFTYIIPQKPSLEDCSFLSLERPQQRKYTPMSHQGPCFARSSSFTSPRETVRK